MPISNYRIKDQLEASGAHGLQFLVVNLGIEMVVRNSTALQAESLASSAMRLKTR